MAEHTTPGAARPGAGGGADRHVARAEVGRAWERHRTTRMSVREAREWAEGCHLQMATGLPSDVGAHAIPTLVEALAVLWQQERALRREVSLLQDRLGIHPSALAAPPAPAPAGAEDEERIYPCADCGTMRTKAEGGTAFTVCDVCWDKAHPKAPVPAPGAAGPVNEVRQTKSWADVRPGDVLAGVQVSPSAPPAPEAADARAREDAGPNGADPMRWLHSLVREDDVRGPVKNGFPPRSIHITADEARAIIARCGDLNAARRAAGEVGA